MPSASAGKEQGDRPGEDGHRCMGAAVRSCTSHWTIRTAAPRWRRGCQLAEAFRGTPVEPLVSQGWKLGVEGDPTYESLETT